MEKLLYSKKEAEELTGISQHTFTRDILAGRIKHVQYGRRVLIPREELLRIAKEGFPKAEA